MMRRALKNCALYISRDLQNTKVRLNSLWILSLTCFLTSSKIDIEHLFKLNKRFFFVNKARTKIVRGVLYLSLTVKLFIALFYVRNYPFALVTERQFLNIFFIPFSKMTLSGKSLNVAHFFLSSKLIIYIFQLKNK